MQQFLKPGKTNTGDKKDVHVWEPHFFEHPDGRIGLLVRVSNAAPEDGLTADQMILYAESKDGGVNFSYPRAVDIETISSRHQSFSMVVLVNRSDAGGQRLVARLSPAVAGPARNKEIEQQCAHTYASNVLLCGIGWR